MKARLRRRGSAASCAAVRGARAAGSGAKANVSNRTCVRVAGCAARRASRAARWWANATAMACRSSGSPKRCRARQVRVHARRSVREGRKDMMH